MSDPEDEDEVMGQTLGSKLPAALIFSHEYDFGSTTNLGFRVAGR